MKSLEGERGWEGKGSRVLKEKGEVGEGGEWFFSVRVNLKTSKQVVDWIERTSWRRNDNEVINFNSLSLSQD